MSISLGLNTAVRALITQQQALNTVAHNIANANTPGYSRQDVQLITTEPFTLPSQNRSALAGQIGTGVTIAQIRRLRDQFLDAQFRLQNQALGMQDAVAQGLHNVEDFFNEPSNQGLANEISQFFNKWRDLTNDPSNQASRLSLRAQAADMTSFIRGAAVQLVQQQQNLDQQVLGKVDQINSLAQRINSLNDQIGKVLAVGDTPNDLRDRRDLLVDQLSRIVRITAFEDDRGNENITLGGTQLVGQNYVNTMKTQLNGVTGFRDLIWADNSAVNVTGGEMRGVLDLRDTTVAGILANLNTLAAMLLNAVNAQHQLGHTLNDTTNNSLNSATGISFFTAVAGKEAATIDVSADILADPNNIAAATNPNAPGDSGNADAIASLQFQLLMSGGTTTMEDFYRGIISTLGSQGQQADNQSANQLLLVQHIDTSRQAISGVSIDEEATKQIEFQRGFEAAARVVSTFDSMLDTLINHMGAGR
jgi:flagellar hook-associated protein 1 FlgK